MNILFDLVPKENVVYVYDEDTLEEAMKVMEHYRYTSVPVLSGNGKYVGSLREGDILWDLKARGDFSWEIGSQILVRQLKRLVDNQPVNISCSMEELIPTAMEQNFIPVVDDDQTFIGIVTRKSVISFCAKEGIHKTL